MARTQSLRHNIVNQFIDAINNGHINSPLPSQSTLAEMYSISRTTIRHTLEHLQLRGVLEKVDDSYLIVREPAVEDGFDSISETRQGQQSSQFERAFYQMISQHQLLPGDTFTEMQLARAANVNPAVVREFLLRFSRYNLIENVRRGLWSMLKLNQSYAEKLFELREMLETHALNRFMSLPANNPHWLQAKELLDRHRQLRESVGANYRAFSQLDHQFHGLLLSAADNPFFNQSLEIITVIFHFHYQWDESDLKERNTLAIEEHIAILSAMICRNDLSAMNELRRHLNTAKQSMIRSISQHSD